MLLFGFLVVYTDWFCLLFGWIFGIGFVACCVCILFSLKLLVFGCGCLVSWFVSFGWWADLWFGCLFCVAWYIVHLYVCRWFT